MINIQTVTVVGATGTMGGNIAGIFASFGGAKVYCIGRDIKKVKNVIPRIVKSVKADAIANRLIPADFSMLAECVAESELVFESISENMEIKIKIVKQVGEYIREGTIFCTGTSGLSIAEIASYYPENLRERFWGIHMFNPPYSMPLCEMISTRYTNKEVRAEVKEYLEKKLCRTVVEVKDSPAFLGNRIGFQFLNESLQYAVRFKDSGGIDYMDAILGSFTGRAMPPLVTSDFVGLDVHKAIVDNVYENTNDYAHNTFILPEFVETLILKKKLGRKSGGGLYQLVEYDSGLKRLSVYDINTGLYRDVIPYTFIFVDKMKRWIAEGDYQKAFQYLINNHSQEAEICLSFLLKYIVYSLYTAKEVGYTIEAVDDVMATGFNWCPPLAMCQAISSVTDLSTLIKMRLTKICEKIDIDQLLADIKPSKYDYRRYFKSGK